MPSRYTAMHEWDDIGEPVIVNHGDEAHMFETPYHHERAHGYCLAFKPKDIPVVEKLLAELRSIETAKAQEATDAAQ